MDIKRARPHPRLQGVVRAFEERRAALEGAELSWPVPARPHQVLIFHLGEPYRVAIDGGPAKTTSDTGLVGPQSYRRAHVRLSGSVHAFTVLFQPTGLHRLIGIDMTSLLNRDPGACDVLGRSAERVRSAVMQAADFEQRVAAVEAWLGALLDARGPDCAIAAASRRMISDAGDVRIADLVAASGLSPRQFQRRFAAQVGMAPKLFTRTIRFERVLSARRSSPGRSWTDIAHAFGYFDQAHFIRECRAFAGLPPSRLVGDWDNVFFPGG